MKTASGDISLEFIGRLLSFVAQQSSK
jgi:hypothetical protein